VLSKAASTALHMAGRSRGRREVIRLPSTTTSSSLTITDFTKVLTGSYGLNSSYYLSSVQAGVEVWTGEGQIDSNSYSVTVG